MLTYCYGKKDICTEPICTTECEFHDDSGARLLQTNFEKIKAMTEADWAAAILQLYVELTDDGIDFGSMFCDGSQDCYDEEGNTICDDTRRLECVKRWLNSPVDKAYRLPKSSKGLSKSDNPCDTCLRWPECNGVDKTCPLLENDFDGQGDNHEKETIPAIDPC